MEHKFIKVGVTESTTKELTTKEVFVIKWIEEKRYYREDWNTSFVVGRLKDWTLDTYFAEKFDSYPEAQKILTQEIATEGTFSIEKLFIKTHKYVD